MSAVTPAGGDTAAGRSWPEVLSALLAGRDLSAADTAWAMDRFMSGEASDAQIAGFMVALRAKGETVEEINGLVEAMYAHAQPLHIPGPAVDIVGTGGDRAKTVNISTMSAVVIAGTGAKVVKHGNRASSSASGPRTRRARATCTPCSSGRCSSASWACSPWSGRRTC